MDPLERILMSKSQELHTIVPNATVFDAVETMCLARVGALLVMDGGAGGALRGIFSERDLMTRVVLARRDPAATRVADVMTRDLVQVPPDAPPRDVMGLMTRRRVRHIPVVKGGRLVGIVSIGDLVRWTIRDHEEQLDRMQDYVTGRYPA